MSGPIPFGIAKIEDEDPHWLWFLDHTNYAPVLDEFELSEEEYIAACRELTNVFSLDWARRVAEVPLNYVGWQGIHPHPFSWLDFHPIARFLVQKPYGGWPQAAPVIRLGRDLLRTKHIKRIQSIRRDLRSLEQYEGRLFELEVLADLCRGGYEPQIVGTPDFSVELSSGPVYLEARHRGVPFWLAASRYIHPFWDGEFPCVRVQITHVSGVRAEAQELGEAISNHLKSLDPDSLLGGAPIVNPRYSIKLEPGGEPRTLVVGYGPDRPWATELESLVFGTLVEKSRQLRAVAEAGGACAVVMDCRSLLPPEVANGDAVRRERRERLKASILDAGARFLREYPWVSGIVWWWKVAGWPHVLREMIHQPPLMTQSTPAGHIERVDLSAFTNQPG